MKQIIKCLTQKWHGVVFFVFAIASLNPCMAGDLQSCSDNLDQLKLVSAAAADTNVKVVSSRKVFEQVKRQMQDCIRNPEKFDPHQDQCSSLMKKWGAAKGAYDTARAAFKKEMDQIERYSQGAQQACQAIQGSVAAAESEAQQARGEAAAQDADTTIEPNNPPTAVRNTKEEKTYNSTELEFCMRNRTATECRKRLNLE